MNFYNPHSILGVHPHQGGFVIRQYRPGAHTVYVEVRGQVAQMKQVSDGLFEYSGSGNLGIFDYRVYHKDGSLHFDPYVFTPLFGEIDAHLFNRGVHYKIYNVMGGRIKEHQGIKGALFSLWAPNAKKVCVVADFNGWESGQCVMRLLGNSGVWEIFVPGLTEFENYKFEIEKEDGSVHLKSDPYAHLYELRPSNASRLFDVDAFEWSDEKWMKNKAVSACPINIYEVHLGSWRKGLNYRELATALADYCLEMHYTHIELLPVTEHPLDESWGYQVTGFFAATSRFGSPSDFQYFVNHMHEKGIGVILDWVPAHFPVDAFSLSKLDGTSLYEHEDPRQGFHPQWSTLIFNYGRLEVSNFLVASALFWLDKMHIDGLRVDAVTSMLHLDYGREDADFIPNIYGGKENLEAIEFIKHLNAIVHEHFPKTLMFAEESTSFKGVTHPLDQKGLGFDAKWNMGWMNDTLKYFQTDPVFRKYIQNTLTFTILYAFKERFTLVLSHDEVVHGKGSLISKMPGDDWQKFANVRLLYSYMMCQPGMKLSFMGNEIGQWNEWNCKDEVNWWLLNAERHQSLQACFKELNAFYKNSAPLWERDFSYLSFEWIDFHDFDNSVISYLRKSSSQTLACVHNFTPAYFENYLISLPKVKGIKEVFNTDSVQFGGSGKVNTAVEIVRDDFKEPVAITIKLSPLATMIFEVIFYDEA